MLLFLFFYYMRFYILLGTNKGSITLPKQKIREVLIRVDGIRRARLQ